MGSFYFGVCLEIYLEILMTLPVEDMSTNLEFWFFLSTFDAYWFCSLQVKDNSERSTHIGWFEKAHRCIVSMHQFSGNRMLMHNPWLQTLALSIYSSINLGVSSDVFMHSKCTTYHFIVYLTQWNSLPFEHQRSPQRGLRQFMMNHIYIRWI